MNHDENRDFSVDEFETEEVFEEVNGYAPVVPVEFNRYEFVGREEKKSYINTSLKIACGILVLFVAFFAVFMLIFNPTQEKALKNSDLRGTWIYRNGDVASYYVFSEDGRLMMKNGTITTLTGYGISLDKDNTFYLYAYGSSDSDNASEMKFKKYTDDNVDTLKIYMEGDEDDAIILQRSELPEFKLTPSKSFKADNRIVGKWENKENDLAITISDDGYLQLDFASIIYDATYVIDGNKVDFTFATSFSDDTSQTQSFYYEVDGDNFIFYMSEPSEGNGYTFTKVKD